jgi:Ca2+-binding EF-hand superfamily protein
MHHPLLITAALALTLVSATPSVAHPTASATPSAATYENAEQIPEVLRRSLRNGVTIEQYLADVERVIRMTESKTSLTQSDIDERMQRSIRERQRQQLTMFVDFDINRDGKINPEEIKQFLMQHNHLSPDSPHLTAVVDAEVAKTMKFDVNHDGVVTYEEMSTLLPEEKTNIESNSQCLQMKAYLALDPNHDGTLTIPELDDLARKAFATMDKNGDGILSQDESNPRPPAQQEVPPSTPSGQRESQGVSSPACTLSGFTVPEDLVVYGAGFNYGHSLDIQIDDSGEAAWEMDVVVNEPDKPVALVLLGYQPTIWNISYTPKTKIVAVVTGGYYRPIVSGLPQSVPSLISYVNGFSEPCGSFYFTNDKKQLISSILEKFFGKSMERFQVPNGPDDRIVLGPLDYDEKSLIKTEIPLERYQLAGTRLARIAGLKEAISKGELRVATEADIAAWQQEYLKHVPATADNNQRPQKMPKVRAWGQGGLYTVLKDDFIIPAGLFGSSYGAAFIVPKGISLPRGNHEHSPIFDMNTGQCLETVLCNWD